MKSLTRDRCVILGFAVPLLLDFALLVGIVGYAAGCSALNYAQSAPANKTITEVIADAGTAANTAEQMYQSGQIPQTATARAVINDLGNAYNDAKHAYLAVLSAETEYHAAVNTQLAACTPAAAGSAATTSSGSAASCTTATAHATATKATLDTANTSLSDKVNALTTKVSAVKALSPAK